MIATAVIAVPTAILAAATILSFLRISHGFVRVCAFPRLQIFALAVLLAVLSLVVIDDGTWLRWLFAVQLLVAIAQAVSIAQFTPLRATQSRPASSTASDAGGDNRISVLASNVKMSNRDYQRAIDLVARADPDVALFMETDEPWCRALREALAERYAHRVERALGNGYGIILFSRLALEDPRIHTLTMDEVPSIITTVRLRDGQAARLYCVHPEPPVPYADSAGRDAELLRVAERVDADAMPSIVFGDLNDVAWSHTTRLFQRLSRLADPRVGRGFYNTFDARFPLLRWPLDHLFHDVRYDLVSMKRLEHIGSDHFPIFFELALTPKSEGVRPEDEYPLDDKAAAAIYADARSLDRGPVGSDWED